MALPLLSFAIYSLVHFKLPYLRARVKYFTLQLRQTRRNCYQ